MILSLFARDYSRRLEFFSYLLFTFLIISSRLVWRLYTEKRNIQKLDPSQIKRTLVVGAGEGGRVIVNSLTGSKTANDIEIIGFVDDDPNKQNIYLSNYKVLGKIKDLPKLIEKYQVDTITLAIPSLNSQKIRRIFNLLESQKVKVNTLPAMEEFVTGKVSMSKLKEIDVVDLLGRDEVTLDMDSIKDQITNKVILVTGAGGSIGSEICRQVIKFNPKKLLLLGHGENSIYLIERELKNRYKA